MAERQPHVCLVDRQRVHGKCSQVNAMLWQLLHGSQCLCRILSEAVDAKPCLQLRDVEVPLWPCCCWQLRRASEIA